GYRRHHRRGGISLSNAHGRAERARREARVPLEDAALDAREVAWARGRGDQVPATVSRPDCESRGSENIRDTGAHHLIAAAATRAARLHRSRDANDAAAI